MPENPKISLFSFSSKLLEIKEEMDTGKAETSSERGGGGGGGGDDPKLWQSYHTVYTNAKAGMEGVDKEKVQRVVYEMSKGSKYFENEERKEAFMRKKIENIRAQCEKLTPSHISHYQKVADQRILELEATRDLSRIWLHVDMDAFYAAVETLSNPSLKGKPMAVGSMSMISTANYEARKFGVRAAMPGFIACKLCPELIFVPTDFKKYTHYSNLTRRVFQKYDPNFMAASLDEAYLDITEVCKERGMTGAEIAEELRSSVTEETGLTCSAGVAPNRLLAKVCSDINKPNGQFVLPNDRLAVMTFISSFPIRKIGGIGKVTEHILRDGLGIKTCEDMVQKGGLLCALFSDSKADFFLSVGLGLGKTDTPQVKFRKSISSERTFSATNDEVLLHQKLADIAKMLWTDMAKEGLHGQTLTLKLKTASFEVRSRAVTLQKYICSSEDLLKHASKLLRAELPISLRLIGLRVSHFDEDKGGASPDPTQKTLSKFLVSGDASGNCLIKPRPMVSLISDQDLMNDAEPSISIDSHDNSFYEVGDPLGSNNQRDLDNHHWTLSNEIIEKVSTTSVAVQNPESCQTGGSKLNESEVSSPVDLEGSWPDMVSKEVIMKNEPAFSSESKDPLFWVDDYKCSLCGIEMPPEFVEERQEHSDFHLAERLQKEESNTDSTAMTKRQRSIKKNHLSSSRKHKKHKHSPKDGRHLPIDMFFVKSNQNF